MLGNSYWEQKSLHNHNTTAPHLLCSLYMIFQNGCYHGSILSTLTQVTRLANHTHKASFNSCQCSWNTHYLSFILYLYNPSFLSLFPAQNLSLYKYQIRKHPSVIFHPSPCEMASFSKWSDLASPPSHCIALFPDFIAAEWLALFTSLKQLKVTRTLT